MRLLLGLCLVLLSSPLSEAQAPPAQTNGSNPNTVAPATSTASPIKPSLTIRVRLKITGTNPADADMVRSYVSHDLRSLDDVNIVDDGDLITLNCIIMPSELVNGIRTGYILSWAVTSQVNSVMALTNATNDTTMNPATLRFIKIWLKGDESLVDHYISTCATNDLKTSVEGDIAKIDGSDLEDVRKLVRQLNGAN